MKRVLTTLLLVFGAVFLISCSPERKDKGYFPITVEKGATVQAPETPQKDGYVFKGYYTTRRGHTWLEQDPVEFPYTADKDITLFAYFEPESSVAANYDKNETYVTSMTSGSRLILNPLVYEWNHETGLIDDMVTPLYSTEVDWDLAIEDGIADAPGDFSKIVSGEFSIEAFDYKYILVGAKKYPVNEKNESAVDEEGNYDRDLARELLGKEWTYEIREDLVFEDGTPITTATFEYTLKNWLDPDQNNYRANMWYRTEDNKNGRPLDMGYEYYTQTKIKLDENGEPFLEPKVDANGNVVLDRNGNEVLVEIYEPAVVTWEEVGFEIIDDYTFKITTFEDVAQSDAVGMGNDLRLVHPEKYAASIDRASGKAQYGTPAYKYMSYGPYVMKSWDENQKMVFNKNYDYVLKGTINYKSVVYEIVDDVHAQYQLFRKKRLSVLGLTKDYYAEFAEDPRVKDSWVNFPQYMIVNLSDSKLGEDGYKSPTIMQDKRFRQALLFGFDRKHFAYNVYAPNKPTLMPIPNNSKNYLYDVIEYTESQAHLDLLDELEINVDDFAFDKERAVELFDAAYADWLADDNVGPVKLKYVTDDDEFSISLDEYIKNSLESLFEKNGEKRLIIDVKQYSGDGLEHEQVNLNFDLMLTALGFGHAQNAYWQYAAIALFPAAIGASGFGLNYPYIGDGKQMDAITEEDIRVDFRNTYDYLSALEELTAAQQAFFDMLEEDGFYDGPMFDISMYVLGTSPASNMFWASPEEPFAGASEDLHNLTAAFERLFLDYVPVVPTVTRSSSTLYADNVTIEWPEYSDSFGWGAARYRYLNSDHDFYQD